MQWYPPSWIGPIFSNGPDVMLNGTIPVCSPDLGCGQTDQSTQEVRQQILELNPDYDQDFSINTAAANGGLQRRGQLNPVW